MNAILLITSLVLLAGCSAFGQAGCSGSSCARPVSNAGEVVIWWPATMRERLGSPEEPVEFTVISMED